MPQKPNILLVTADALRTDALGCYDSAQALSPSLDSLAGEGVVCESFFCSAIPVIASLSSLLTGQHPVALGMASGREAREIPFGTSFLPQIFLEAGYTTCAFDNLRRERHWFGRGYEFYADPGVRHHRAATCQEMNARVIPWLRTHAAEPFFLSIHYRDLAAAPGAALYAGAVRSLDACMGELAAAVADLRLAEKTLVAFTATHGQSLGEPRGLYDSTVRVPLALRWPGRVPSGTHLSGMFQMHDLPPTLLEAAGLRAPSNMEGESFWKALTGERKAGGRDKIMILECGEPPNWSLRTRDRKFIRSAGPAGEIRRELYD